MTGTAPTRPPLRIGILGTPRIAREGIVRPAARVAGAEVRAVASRDAARARAFAREHAIPEVLPDYAALVASPDVDAVYNALPNALHAEWTLRALRAGKHVLCEKPLASNADEAGAVARAARESGRALVEAFHWRYHPLAARVREILDAGGLGSVVRAEAAFTVPFGTTDDIRFDWTLAGGATMDLGCYALQWVRFAVGEEPDVVRARAQTGAPPVDARVDVRMEAELRFPGGASGRILCAMQPDAGFGAHLDVETANGRLRVRNPLAPHIGHRLHWESADDGGDEEVAGESTYTHQLRAFVAHVREGAPVPTGPDDAVANMRAVDAVYRAAGLPPRGT